MPAALRRSALFLVFSVGLFAGLAPAATQTPVLEIAVVRVVSAAASGDEIRYSMGSGFFVNEAHIVTNEHIVGGSGSSPELFVLFAGRNTPEAVELSWSSPDLDLAILRYRGDAPRAALEFATPDPIRGAEVFALGYPGPADAGSMGGATSSTLTEGILSRAPFDAQWGRAGTKIARVLQHTAAINPGSSGGPLVNACGTVVGINTRGATRELRDADGNVVGRGAAEGIFFALAVSELSAELRRRGVEFSPAEECVPDSRDSPLPAFLIAVLLLALLATGAWLIGRRSRPIASQEPRRDPRGNVLPPDHAAESAQSGRLAHAEAIPSAMARFAGQCGAPDLSLPVPDLKGARHGLSFGRNPQLVDRALSDPTLSRRHFRVSLESGRLFVEDLGSTHGTFVNGTRLKPYHARRLEDGDTVRASGGEWRFTAKESGWK